VSSIFHITGKLPRRAVHKNKNILVQPCSVFYYPLSHDVWQERDFLHRCWEGQLLSSEDCKRFFFPARPEGGIEWTGDYGVGGVNSLNAIPKVGNKIKNSRSLRGYSPPMALITWTILICSSHIDVSFLRQLSSAWRALYLWRFSWIAAPKTLKRHQNILRLYESLKTRKPARWRRKIDHPLSSRHSTAKHTTGNNNIVIFGTTCPVVPCNPCLESVHIEWLEEERNMKHGLDSAQSGLPRGHSHEQNRHWRSFSLTSWLPARKLGANAKCIAQSGAWLKRVNFTHCGSCGHPGGNQKGSFSLRQGNASSQRPRMRWTYRSAYRTLNFAHTSLPSGFFLRNLITHR